MHAPTTVPAFFSEYSKSREGQREKSIVFTYHNREEEHLYWNRTLAGMKPFGKLSAEVQDSDVPVVAAYMVPLLCREFAHGLSDTHSSSAAHWRMGYDDLVVCAVSCSLKHGYGS